MIELEIQSAEEGVVSVWWCKSVIDYKKCPDWKVCRMRGGSLIRQNCLCNCVCVTKQWFYCFLLLFYANLAAGTTAEI